MKKNKKIILTGDRPTGKLHLGHYVGSLKNRVKLQNSGEYDEIYIEIADTQAITDNFFNIEKVRQNVIEVTLDYLACGIDPEKTTIFVQSQIPELYELTAYYLNLVTLSRLQRNPTIKDEMKLRGFETSLPMGFLTYPVSQAADITLFDASIVPVGEDQAPMIEQTRELARAFNNAYKKVIVEPEMMLPDNKVCLRLPGVDGKAKMSKSLGNGIFLSDEPEIIEKKIMSMYTDPDHIKIEDPGKVEGNVVFTYLDAFCTDEYLKKYLPAYKNLDELKNHYKRGGLGDVTIKRFLNSIIQEELEPIRNRRKEYEKNIPEVYEMLMKSTAKAREKAISKIAEIRDAMRINYFDDKDLINEQSDKYSK